MITNEMKARCFGMYLGCPCTYKNEWGKFNSEIDWQIIQWVQNGGNSSYQLILTPLSEITDEDVLDLASIYHPEITWTFANRTRTFIELDGHDGQTFTLFYSLSVISEDSNFDNILPADNLKYHIQTIDFLRSRGYALPYMGIDLFESGIAIPNNKMK